MIRKLAILLLPALVAWAGGPLPDGRGSEYDGRWDITVQHAPRGRAWWLEVAGAGSDHIKGKFVGFPGGDLNDIQHIWVENGELRFTYDGHDVHQDYRARLADGKLEGTFASGDTKLGWTGARTPEITDADDGSWHEFRPIDLFNGRDISNWHGLTADAAAGWSVRDGILRGNGAAPDLVSNVSFWNFKLHVEYRTPAHSNSGIGLRGRYEVQILEDYGRPVDRHSNGALYSRIVPSENATKPAGEWQTFDIRLVGRHATVTLNGKTVTQGIVDGLTAIACDPDEGDPGPIMLQGDHGPVEFRSIVLTPLVKAPPQAPPVK
jgi:3-keto-disaccharide hydrolase